MATIGGGKSNRTRKQLRVGANGSTVAATVGELTARRDGDRSVFVRYVPGPGPGIPLYSRWTVTVVQLVEHISLSEFTIFANTYRTGCPCIEGRKRILLSV